MTSIAYSWQPRLAMLAKAWEPSSADMEPHRTLVSFDFYLSTRCQAIVNYISRRWGSRPHRGGQGVKSPQLHRVLPGRMACSGFWPKQRGSAATATV